MIITNIDLKERLKDYASPKSKITRMLKDKKIIQLKRGLYLEGNIATYSLKAISGILYGPSYVSFESALSYYGLIPEKVRTVTCAAFGKNKTKSFSTPIGSFHYFHIPDKVYPYETVLKDENNYSFLIASQEKAVLDTLYKLNYKKYNFDDLIYSDLRIDKTLLQKLDSIVLDDLSILYNRTICTSFANWFKKEFINA